MKLSFQLGLLSALNLGVSFLYQWYVFTQLGPGMETDALFAGMTIPQLILVVITGSLMNVLVPLLAGEDEKQLHQDAWGFMLLITTLFLIIFFLLYFTAGWWIPITVPGFTIEAQNLTVSLAKIQLLGIVFAAVSAVQWAIYHSRQQFVQAEFTPILASSLGFLFLIWALPVFGVAAAAWAFILRMALQVLFLAPSLGRPVLPNMKSPAMIEAWHRIKPLLLGTIYYKTEPVADRFFLSWSASGNLSLYYLAQRLCGVINQIFNKALTAPMVPLLGNFHKVGNAVQFRRLYYRKLLQMTLLGLAGFIAVIIIGRPLLNLLIGHGSVTADNVQTLWWIMIWLGGNLVGGMAGQITSSAFYASGDTVTPTKLSVCIFTLFLPAKALSFYFWGIAGLAISTSFYYMISLILQIYLIERKAIWTTCHTQI